MGLWVWWVKGLWVWWVKGLWVWWVKGLWVLLFFYLDAAKNWPNKKGANL
jgi:hypothetical protein